MGRVCLGLQEAEVPPAQLAVLAVPDDRESVDCPELGDYQEIQVLLAKRVTEVAQEHQEVLVLMDSLGPLVLLVLQVVRVDLVLLVDLELKGLPVLLAVPVVPVDLVSEVVLDPLADLVLLVRREQLEHLVSPGGQVVLV